MPGYSEAIDWLLHSGDPSVRYLALTDVLRKDPNSSEVSLLKDSITEGQKVKALLSGQQEDGGFGRNPYVKWTGAHWRLVSLANLAVPPHDRRAVRMAENVLNWIHARAKMSYRFPIRNGLTRMHASVYGNPVGACSYFGYSSDPRVQYVVDTIVRGQWPDGGWNCDPKPAAGHSSFHESLATLWGLVMFRNSSGDRRADAAIEKACELILSHRIFRSHRSGEIINKDFLKLRYPVYWHYNFLEAMRVISLAGKGMDSRMSEALDILESKCSEDGKWAVEGCYWRPPSDGPGHKASQEAVDWGRKGPNEMITLNALRVLKSAGRM